MPAVTAMQRPTSPTTAVPLVVERGMLRKPIVTPSIVAVVATDVTDPLSVMLPDVVTVPERLRPLAEPVPPTDVTVPVLLVYPDGLLAGYAPSDESAKAAVVAPVPPLAIGRVPVTLVVRLQ